MNPASVILAEVPCRRPALERVGAERPRLWSTAILGVPFDAVSTDGALERIEAMIASREPHYVVTANVDFLVQARHDVELRRILIEADLVLCDGTPLLWAARWLGNALPERVAGSDLTPSLIQTAATKGYRLYLLGAGPGVAAAAAEKLQQEHPTLQIAGHYSPPLTSLLDMDHEAIAERIRAAKPDILLVAFGCPKQEKWIAMHYRALGVPVCIGVGATIDFLAGRVRRAPTWMRRSGCEWLYRLAQEPRRLYRRYAADAVGFAPALLAQWWRMAGRPQVGPSAAPLSHPEHDVRLIDAGLALTRGTLEQHAVFWHAVQASNAHGIIEASRLRRIDAAGVAFLVQCRKALRERGRQLVLVDPHRVARRVLATLRLADFFTVTDSVAEAYHLVGTAAAATVLDERDPNTLAWCAEITAQNATLIWQLTTAYIQERLAAGQHSVTINLKRVQFVDSAGAGLMVRLKRWAEAQHVRLEFAEPQPNVRNVLQLTRVGETLWKAAA
jgi:exopolysaccharide biosynthesis WecB/TagA/CpsF family protein/anti-anti-sigma factor